MMEPDGGNKLRTYRLFKSSIAHEPYLNVVNNRDKRILLTKFRIGICPLRSETGRYENVGNRLLTVKVYQLMSVHALCVGGVI